MGCGSSSLKGEPPSADLNTPAQPVTRVRSNFADVDFGADSKRRKSTKLTDRAPHEVDEPSSSEPSQPSEPSQSAAPVPSEQPASTSGEIGMQQGDLAQEGMDRTNKAEAAETEASKLEPYQTMTGEGEGAGEPALGSGGLGESALGDREKVPDLVR